MSDNQQPASEQPKRPYQRVTYKRTLAADRSRIAVYVSNNKDILAKKTPNEAQALVESTLSVTVPVSVLNAIAAAVGVTFLVKRKNYDKDMPKTTIGTHTKIRLLAGFVSNLYEQLGVAIPPALKTIHRGARVDDAATDQPKD